MSYWNQWGHVEILSLHGVEDEALDFEKESEAVEEIEEEIEEEYHLSLDSLGLSWRDFM